MFLISDVFVIIISIIIVRKTTQVQVHRKKNQLRGKDEKEEGEE